MMTTAVPFASYLLGVRVKANLAKPLACRLERSAPDDLWPTSRAALREVVSAADAVDAMLTERERAPQIKVAPHRKALMDAWGALHDACLALARIPAGAGDRGGRAEALKRKLFVDGIGFVHRESLVAWSESTRMLRRIDQEGMRGEIESLLGADMLVAVDAATRALGEAIGVGDRPAIPVRRKDAVREAVIAFQRAVAAYCRRLAGEVDEHDPVSVARFVAAMRPIDAHRAAHAPSRARVAQLDQVGDVLRSAATVEPSSTDFDTPAAAAAPALRLIRGGKATPPLTDRSEKGRDASATNVCDADRRRWRSRGGAEE